MSEINDLLIILEDSKQLSHNDGSFCHVISYLVVDSVGGIHLRIFRFEKGIAIVSY